MLGDPLRFDKDTYLKRIGITDDVAPNGIASDEEGLRLLHQRQTQSIPFENFDVLLDRKIDLDPMAVWRKIVEGKRGGYCFELNGLMLRALHAFGFHARPLLGRVHLRGETSSRTHQVNLVELDGMQWMIDAGFGGWGPHAPMRFVADEPQEQMTGVFRLKKDQTFGHMLQVHQQGDWMNLYSFDLETVIQQDIELGNYYTSTHPTVIFKNAALAAIMRVDGRTTLFDFMLGQIKDGTATEQNLEPGPSYITALEEYFGIKLDAPFEALSLFTGKNDP